MVDGQAVKGGTKLDPSSGLLVHATSQRSNVEYFKSEVYLSDPSDLIKGFVCQPDQASADDVIPPPCKMSSIPSRGTTRQDSMAQVGILCTQPGCSHIFRQKAQGICDIIGSLGTFNAKYGNSHILDHRNYMTKQNEKYVVRGTDTILLGKKVYEHFQKSHRESELPLVAKRWSINEEVKAAKRAASNY